MKHINFPKDFIWGTASSSYQTEGAYNRDGKGASIWDTFCQKSGVIADSSDGTLACCYYDNYEEDIRFMADAGIRAYRFSVSWPRIFPNGDDPAVNPLGLAFYDRVVDCCIRYGIQPHITLFHWDLPQSLSDRGGWLSAHTIEAFVRYAAVICEHFSDRVTYFSTINEPQIISKITRPDTGFPCWKHWIFSTHLPKLMHLPFPQCAGLQRNRSKSVFQVPEICAIHAVKMKRISVPQEL